MGVDRIFFCLDLYEIYKAHVEYSRYISFIFVFNSPEPKMMWIYLFFSLPKFEWCDLPDTRSGLFNIVSNATTNVLFCCPCINNLSYMSVNNFINVLKRYFGRIFFYFIKHIFWNFFTSHDQFLLVWGLGLVVLFTFFSFYQQVLIRRLPPTLTPESLLEQLSPLPSHEFYFVRADMRYL